MKFREVQIGNQMVGDGHKPFVIAEIGINHNGDLSIAKRLISAAAGAGADAVKFQKRTIDVVYSAEELAKPREFDLVFLKDAFERGVLPEEARGRLQKSEMTNTTNGDLKRVLELSLNEYVQVDRHCRSAEIMWLASCWDEASVDFIDEFDPPCYKIASASLTDDGLLEHTKATGKPIILSTGLSTMEQVEHAVDVLGQDNLVILHCVGTYPARNQDLNLRAIGMLREKYPTVPIGYSGHEKGIIPPLYAVALGACVIEKHVTLEMTMPGSDQMASIEPPQLTDMIRNIAVFSDVSGDGVKRLIDAEIPVRDKLRRK